MEPNLYCFPLAARMTNRYFAAVGFAGFAAAHFAGTDRAVAGVVVVGTGAGDHLAADHIEVADTPAEEAVNH